MERRVALKNMAMAMGGLVSLPAWASGWNKDFVKDGLFLNADSAETLKSVVDAMIPKTDTPGAADLGVDLFVQKMVTDCYDQKAQDNLSAGLTKVETRSKAAFGKTYRDLSQSQKLEVLAAMQGSGDTDEKSFLGLTKNLTIQGYMNSEYVMTNITHYELIPGRYHGCVPVQKG